MASSSSHDLPPGPSPEERAGWFSRLTFMYVNPLLRIGLQRPLMYDDLGALGAADHVEVNLPRFRECFTAERERVGHGNDSSKMSMIRVIVRSVGYCRLAAVTLLWLIQISTALATPLVFSWLIKSLSRPDEARSFRQWLFALLMMVVPLSTALTNVTRIMFVNHLGVQLKASIKAALYRKALRLSNAGLQQTSRGQVMTVMSADTPQMQQFVNGFNNMWAVPLRIVGAMYLLYLQVGLGLLGALAVLLISIPLTTTLMRRAKNYQRMILRSTDRRTKIITEILSGIAVVKLYAWDEPMRARVAQARALELKFVNGFLVCLALGIQLVARSTVTIMMIVVFTLYVKVFDGNMEPATAFTALMLFQSIRIPFLRLPMVFVSFLRALVAAERIANVLCLPELGDPTVIRDGDFAADDNAIELSDATFSWEASRAAAQHDGVGSQKPSNAKHGKVGQAERAATSAEEGVALVPAEECVGFTLHGINLSVPRGKLVGIVGGVGSGKSTLLQAMLGQVQCAHGTAVLRGSVAYIEQRVWIMNATLRENVLFGSEFDATKYWAAIDACAMREDLDALQGGDQCEIGERGVNLSGGQKVRVSCARAAYVGADIVLADDPLAAVDAHVAEHLWRQCIKGSMSGSTRVVVMNQLHYLPECDLVVVLDQGRIAEMGTFDELVAAGLDFASLVERARAGGSDEDDSDTTGTSDDGAADGQHDGSSAGDGSDEGAPLANPVAAAADNDGESKATSTHGAAAHRTRSRTRSRSRSKAKSRVRSRSKPPAAEAAMVASRRVGKLVSAEERHTGRMKWSTYLYYVRAGGAKLWTAVLVCCVLSMSMNVVSTFWLGEWSAAAKQGQDESDLDYYMLVFMGISAAAVIAVAMQSFAVAKTLVAGAKVLHEQLLQAVVAAPMSFFDVTPKGRVINRFAKDTNAADIAVGRTLVDAIVNSFSLLFMLVAIAIATKGVLLALFVPLAVVYYRVFVLMRRSGVEVKRMESIANSPVFSSFAETMSGLATIRAFGHEERFRKLNFKLLNAHSLPALTLKQMQMWLNFRMNLMGSAVSLTVALLAVASTGFLDVQWVAIALTYSTRMTTQLAKLVEGGAALEVAMNSVERIKHYHDSIKPEVTVNAREVPKDWPTRGEVRLNNLCVRYRDKPLVLKGVSAVIDAGTRVGICGRTGSGKSTLLTSMFRINNPAEGSIEIDGLDIARVPLPILRSRLAVIPQDPVLFAGNLRSNLDPFTTCSEAELWQALTRVKLAGHVAGLPGKLDTEVAESGDNFSQGQRQMICFARALLRKPRLLFLDEATANVDHDTDTMIQETLREAFADVTIVTIAHRINTIMDSDKIMVLDQGRVAEYGPPKELLANDAGVFRSLVEAASAVQSSLDAAPQSSSTIDVVVQ